MAGDPLKKGRYTKFGNKIGLYNTKDGNFISNTPEVVLNFPFKDAILEAGMTKEDAGRDERFLNIEMDSKDIDALEDPKVLTNFKYIDRDGEKALDENSDIEFFDKNGDLKQNLLIKGNNLLALYTLREKLAGKVKLIYIDPPYNTGSDGFKYNDSFNHSSWLVFMKNRLEIARELLRNDGFICISCDDNEMAYLKVLCDEVLGGENFINTLVIETGEVFGTKAAHIDRTFVKVKDYILIYAKKKTMDLKIKPLFTKTNECFDSHFSYYVKDGRKQGLLDFLKSQDWIRGLFERYSIQFNLSNLSQVMDLNPELKKYIFDISDDICQDQPFTQDIGEEIKAQLDNNEMVQYNGFNIFKTSSGSIRYYKKFSDSLKMTDDYVNEFTRSTARGDLWKNFHIDMRNIDKEGDVKFKSGKKPERLIRDLIYSLSEPNDIFLDYHLGSGTSCAVAQKMGMRWIGIEQMDYIDSLALHRLKNVIDGDKSGISQACKWQGGGSFVYFELKKYNQDFIDRIMAAASIPELEEIYEDMQKNAFLKFFFDKAEFEKDENFRNLDIYKRKEKLVDILDENQLYLNFDEMNDGKYHVTPAEKALTNRFYQANEEDEADNGEE